METVNIVLEAIHLVKVQRETTEIYLKEKEKKRQLKMKSEN